MRVGQNSLKGSEFCNQKINEKPHRKKGEREVNTVLSERTAKREVSSRERTLSSKEDLKRDGIREQKQKRK